MGLLKKGSNGQDVKSLQESLNGAGYDLVVDADFGNGTEAAVKNFQEKNNLVADGLVGAKTWEALNKAQAKPEQLKAGDQGESVKRLQALLVRAGHPLVVDGDFGNKTSVAVMEFQQANGLGADGIVGKKTWAALLDDVGAREHTEPQPSEEEAALATPDDDTDWESQKTWDTHSDKRIATLHPKTRARFIEFIIRAEKELGKKLRVTSGLRTIAEQNDLYAKGRTAGGKIVTNAKGGQSYHNFGLAIDIVEIKGGKALWSNPDWNTIATLGKGIGLEWGGDWRSFKDKPHFQMSFGKSTKDLFALYEAGDRDGEYVHLG